MTKKSSIYTKSGDKGKTSLVGGKRVSKSDISLALYGEVDELNSWIGVILYGLFLGSICRTLENFFKIFNTNKDFPFIAIIFYASLPMIYRGPIRGIIGIPFLFLINTILIFLIFYKRSKRSLSDQKNIFAKSK